MSTNKQDRRGGRRNRRSNRGKSPYQPEKPVYESYTCNICEKPVENPLTALPNPDNQEPSHFDCIISMLAERENLLDGEQIVYMGSNHYAVVDEEEYSKKEWAIKRKIKIDQPEEGVEWRTKMRYVFKT